MAIPIDPYECAACTFARRVLHLCVTHQNRLGIRESRHPSIVDALLRKAEPSEPARVLDFVCAPLDGTPPAAPQRAPHQAEEPPNRPAGPNYRTVEVQ